MTTGKAEGMTGELIPDVPAVAGISSSPSAAFAEGWKAAWALAIGESARQAARIEKLEGALRVICKGNDISGMPYRAIARAALEDGE